MHRKNLRGRFLIVSHAVHKKNDDQIFAYGPYVREMNLWVKAFNQVRVLAPLIVDNGPDKIDLAYSHENISLRSIPNFQISALKYIPKAIYSSVLIFFVCLQEMRQADHIHLRCPGNIGLIGCIAQFFFKKKIKTAKYAGNWDWKSKQPWSYRVQQRILRNTFLSKNMQVLVYGEWPDKTKNIRSFFTATYSRNEIEEIHKDSLDKRIELVFVGSLTENKSPITCLEVCEVLHRKGIPVHLTFCGDGDQRHILEKKIKDLHLESQISLLGNVDAEKVKEVLQKAHFLVFISRSEGWPKAVAEAMFWGCLPITTPVSCVPYMLSHGSRGKLLKEDSSLEDICNSIVEYKNNTILYHQHRIAATKWSQQFTLEEFENEVLKLINDECYAYN